MKLRTWREQEKLTLQQVSDQLGGLKSKSAIARIETGVSDPDGEFIRAIFDLTGGQVTANDFYDLASAESPGNSTPPGPSTAEAAPAGAGDAAAPAGAPEEGRAA